MSFSSPRRALALIVLTALLTPALQSAAHAAPSGFRAVPAPRGTLHLGPATRHLSSTGVASSVVADPAPGPARSTWQVTYTGFTPQAQTAFQAAVDIWARVISSPVPIKVDAHFADLGTNVLGSAGATYSYSDPSLGDGVSWYPSALADDLVGGDIGGTDIDADFSSTYTFYFGTDGNTPSNEIDFESVVLHELGHGLGFAGFMDYSNGQGSYDQSRFDAFSYTAPSGGQRLTSLAAPETPSTTLGTALTSGSVYWGGPAGTAANNGARPKLYAPATWQPGSSYSHLDEATYPAGNANSLMTYAIGPGEVVHSPGPLTVGMLDDLGWDAALPTPATAPSAPTNVTAARGYQSAGLTWTAAAANGSPVLDYTVTTSPGGATTTVTTTGATITGLTNGTAYTFTVTARNAVGSSAPSAATAPVTPATVPDKVTGVTAVPGKTSVTVSWNVPADNGAAITGYVVTPSGLSPIAVDDATPLVVTGLTDATPYTFTVHAVSAEGDGLESDPSLPAAPDADAPVVALTSKPAAATRSTTATVTWTASDPGRPSASLTVSCQLDAGAFGSCPSSWSGLANGSHSVVVSATDEVGNTGTASWTWVVDTVAPTGFTVGTVAPFSLGTTAPVTFSATDSGSGVKAYLVRTRKAAYNGSLGAYGATVTTTAHSYAPAASRGWTYCTSVAAQDNAGNTTAWSADRCTSIPLDDRSLAATSSVSRLSSGSAYAGTYSRATRTGQYVRVSSATGRRVALVVTTCSTCGSVRVAFGTATKTVSLVSSTTRWRVLVVLDFGSVRTGSVTVTTLSAKAVVVDGLGVSRF